MFYGKFLIVDDIKLACLYSKKDISEKYPLPITDEKSASVIKNFTSQKELDSYAEGFNAESKNKVALITKNADFTEGRGPMIPWKLFKEFVDAEMYISKQEGIYCSSQSRSIRTGTNIYKQNYASVYRNGYDIKFMDLE